MGWEWPRGPVSAVIVLGVTLGGGRKVGRNVGITAHHYQRTYKATDYKGGRAEGVKRCSRGARLSYEADSKPVGDIHLARLKCYISQ